LCALQVVSFRQDRKVSKPQNRGNHAIATQCLGVGRHFYLHTKEIIYVPLYTQSIT